MKLKLFLIGREGNGNERAIKLIKNNRWFQAINKYCFPEASTAARESD